MAVGLVVLVHRLSTSIWYVAALAPAPACPTLGCRSSFTRRLTSVMCFCCCLVFPPPSGVVWYGDEAVLDAWLGPLVEELGGSTVGVGVRAAGASGALSA